jgi:hypothetical protein
MDLERVTANPRRLTAVPTADPPPRRPETFTYRVHPPAAVTVVDPGYHDRVDTAIRNLAQGFPDDRAASYGPPLFTTAAEAAAYRASDAWKRRRAAYARAHKMNCRACGTLHSKVRDDDTGRWVTRGNDLHHLTYERADGGELDQDLSPLCHAHHETAHAYEKSGQWGPMFGPGVLADATAAMCWDVQHGVDLRIDGQRTHRAWGTWLLRKLGLRRR